MMNKKFALAVILILMIFSVKTAYAQTVGGVQMPIPKIAFDVTEAKSPKDVALSLQILFLLTILTLAPSIALMMTAFTRIVIVLDFVKRALGLQQMPPTQIIVGLSMFLTFFVMAPTFNKVNDEALQPYMKGQITNEVFFDKAMAPMRTFMLKQTRSKDIALFINIGKIPKPKTQDEIPTYCLIPAFMISEMTRAFEMGVYIFVPFIVIDMIVASALMAMGMIMLPPVMISMPFKIVLFILVDGWNLVIYELVKSFKV